MQTQLFAIVGDVHGAHWEMISLLAGWEKARGRPLDFVLQVGDFEPHRDEADLATMAAPAKYRKLGDFPAFARGEALFPWPIFFIGGNHEPYGFIDTLPDGGEIAPNCHYFGRASVLEIGCWRVAGLSGVFQPELFARPHPSPAKIGVTSNQELIAWNESDLEKLLGYASVDVLLLHEWPLIPFDGAIRPSEESGANYLTRIVEKLCPRLICCGHAHFRWSGEFSIGPQNLIAVECLAQVGMGRDAFLVVEGTENGTWKAVP